MIYRCVCSRGPGHSVLRAPVPRLAALSASRLCTQVRGARPDRLGEPPHRVGVPSVVHHQELLVPGGQLVRLWASIGPRRNAPSPYAAATHQRLRYILALLHRLRADRSTSISGWNTRRALRVGLRCRERLCFSTSSRSGERPRSRLPGRPLHPEVRRARRLGKPPGYARVAAHRVHRTATCRCHRRHRRRPPLPTATSTTWWSLALCPPQASRLPPARAVADDKVGVDQLDLEVRLSQPLGVAREYNAMAIQFGCIACGSMSESGADSHASPHARGRAGTP